MNVDGNKVEFLLRFVEEKMAFPISQMPLQNPNVWVADTAATVHMSPHEKGMTNMKTNTGGGITVGNGEVVVAKKRGDIPIVNL